MKGKSVLKILITVALLWLVLRQISLREAMALISHSDFSLLGLAAVFALAFISLRWWKWHLLLDGSVSSLSPGRSLASYLIGTAAGLITPGRVGELGRAAVFTGEDRIVAAGLVVFDRVIDLVTVLTFALAGLFIISPSLGAVSSLVTVVMFAAILNSRRLIALSRRLPLIGRLFERVKKIEMFLQGWSNIGLKRMLLLLAVSFASFGVSVWQFHLLAGALHPGISWPAVITSFPVSVLASAAPFTISGFGAREGAVVLMMNRYHIPGEVSTSAILLSFIFNVALPSFIGALACSGIRTDNVAVSADIRSEN
ncbi:MAG: lysylphosphatidylglycerol synthase transmembrane domain-containing protein [bacterium]|nr:lysylphosphatidylglycerol synthase transmembrane domain-containing protein [bacterium]